MERDLRAATRENSAGLELPARCLKMVALRALEQRLGWKRRKPSREPLFISIITHESQSGFIHEL